MNCSQVVTNNILNSMASVLDSNQLNKLRFVLDFELSRVDIIEQKNKLSLPINNEHLLKEFIGSMLVEGKSKSTLKRYKYVIDKLSECIDKDYTEITSQDLKYFLAIFKTQRNCSNTTVNGMRLCLSAFFNWLEREDYISKNPVKKISKIKNDTQPERQLYEYEIELLRKQCSNVRNRAILEFLYSTGCRVSEIIQIKLSEIDFNNKSCIVHGKGNKDRTVYFSDNCMVYLREYISSRNDTSDILFKSLRGNGPIKRDSIELMLKELGNKAGVKNVHPHRLRVTRITNLIDRGMAIQNVQRLAGHNDISTTERYYRTNSNDMKSEYCKYGS